MRIVQILGLLLLGATALPAAAEEPSAACDRVLAQQVFVLCVACHTTSATEPMRTGPPLPGVYGKAAASSPSFRYSAALLAAKLTWNDETLDRFLANPGRAVPGTLMAFPGLRSAQDRAAAICALRSSRRLLLGAGHPFTPESG